MDMDDDFMGEIEFDLSAPQKSVVTKAIDLASKLGGSDSFVGVNPLIAIMQWWEQQDSQNVIAGKSPEDGLAEICEAFIRAHESQ